MPPITPSSIVSIACAIALLGLLMYRQTTWRAVRTGRELRLPVILLVIGFVMFAQDTNSSLTGTGIAILCGEAALTLGIGTLMGRLAHFRLARPQAAALGEAPAAAPQFETRTGAIGIVLWGLLIASRVAAAVFAVSIGIAGLESTGVILLMLGLNRLARAWVLRVRLERHLADCGAAATGGVNATTVAAIHPADSAV